MIAKSGNFRNFKLNPENEFLITNWHYRSSSVQRLSAKSGKSGKGPQLITSVSLNGDKLKH